MSETKPTAARYRVGVRWSGRDLDNETEIGPDLEETTEYDHPDEEQLFTELMDTIVGYGCHFVSADRAVYWSKAEQHEEDWDNDEYNPPRGWPAPVVEQSWAIVLRGLTPDQLDRFRKSAASYADEATTYTLADFDTA